MSVKNGKFELVVPAYNESRNLNALIEAAVSAARHERFTAEDFKLCIVNNGSTDDSAEVLTRLQDTDLGEWFKVVTVEVNQGYGFGIWSGLKETTAPIVGWSHADLQCDPANAIRAYKIVSESSSSRILVKGRRSGRNWKDIFVSRVFEFIACIFIGLSSREVNAQPKVFHRSLLNEIINPPKTFAFDLYVLYVAEKVKFQFHEIEVLFPPRIHGVSTWASTFFGRYRTIIGMIRYIIRLYMTEGRIK